MFFKTLGDDGKDEFWSPIVRGLKRFRFDVSAAPLTKEQFSSRAKALYDLFISKENQSKLAYGWEQSEMFSQIVALTEKMIYIPEQSLLDKLIHLVGNKGHNGIAVVIRESRLISEIEDAINERKELKNVRVVSPENLQNVTCYTKLFIFGSPRWFPEFVFSAPRASEIHVIKHNWIPGKWEPTLVLITPYRARGAKNKKIVIEDETEIEDLLFDVFLPTIDIKRIQDEATEQLIENLNDDNEIVNSRLYILENDWAVFLEADESSEIDIIDIDEDRSAQVKHVKVREIQAGTFILLRTEGGGDYIVPVADRLMGEFKEIARSEQKRWKTLLQEQVKQKGEKKVLDELTRYGSSRATKNNLANWMSMRNIRTADRNDFQAIMRLLGIENETSKLWNIMGEIRKAHSKAGFRIREMLLEQVNKADLEKLSRYGIMEFELADQDAGKLSAFRVKDVAKNTTEVIHWRVRTPFRIDHG